MGYKLSLLVVRGIYFLWYGTKSIEQSRMDVKNEYSTRFEFVKDDRQVTSESKILKLVPRDRSKNVEKTLNY